MISESKVMREQCPLCTSRSKEMNRHLRLEHSLVPISVFATEMGIHTAQIIKEAQKFGCKNVRATGVIPFHVVDKIANKIQDEYSQRVKLCHRCGEETLISKSHHCRDKNYYIGRKTARFTQGGLL